MVTFNLMPQNNLPPSNFGMGMPGLNNGFAPSNCFGPGFNPVVINNAPNYAQMSMAPFCQPMAMPPMYPQPPMNCMPPNGGMQGAGSKMFDMLQTLLDKLLTRSGLSGSSSTDGACGSSSNTGSLNASQLQGMVSSLKDLDRQYQSLTLLVSGLADGPNSNPAIKQQYQARLDQIANNRKQILSEIYISGSSKQEGLAKTLINNNKSMEELTRQLANTNGDDAFDLLAQIRDLDKRNQALETQLSQG